MLIVMCVDVESINYWIIAAISVFQIRLHGNIHKHVLTLSTELVVEPHIHTGSRNSVATLSAGTGVNLTPVHTKPQYSMVV